MRFSDLDRMEDAVLASREGPQHESYGLVDAAVDDSRLYVRALVTGSVEGLFLWMRPPDARRLLGTLRDGLAALPSGTPADGFGRRRLDEAPRPSSLPSGYSDDQAHALEACCAPGLQVIWGPPGTGKTHVVTGAIRRLVHEGRRVLLVSGTNVAVDNAVQRAVAALSSDGGDLTPGVIVRVGTPTVREVGQDARVSLTRLVQERLARTQAEIENLGHKVNELRAAREAAQRELEEANTELASFDSTAYRHANQRRAALQDLEKARKTVRAWHGALAESEQELAGASRRTDAARFEVARLDEHVKSAAVDAAERELQTLSQRTGLARLVARSRLRAAQARRDKVLREKFQATERRQDLQGRLGAGMVLRNLPAAWTAEFGQLDASLRQDLKMAEAIRSSAERHVVQTRKRTDEADAYLERLRAMHGDGLSPADMAVLEDAERRDLPGLQAKLPDLTSAVDELNRQHERLTARLRQRQEAAKKEQAEAEQRIIGEAKVVATTLAMSRLKRAVLAGSYDQVIVDEAAAVALPEVVHAAGLASHGACLLGDFLQNGPIVDRDIERAVRRESVKLRGVYELLADDCFGYFGLTDPSTAGLDQGCVVLTEQRRFGDTITTLANRVAYDGILTRAAPRDGEPLPAEEVVFVDVNGLGAALTTVRRVKTYSGSWPIGALIARALGEHHVRDGNSVGVVGPYKEQMQQTQAILDETDEGMCIEVGTAHAFQGREFDVVIFDTLENGEVLANGNRLGWVGQGSRQNDWLLGGLRLFNVAVTRARHRLYLIGSATALAVAKEGPLAHLRELIDDGAVQQVSAREVLGISTPPRSIESSIDYDLRTALSHYVRVVDLHNQVSVLDEVRRRIDHAEHSVWVWSPWVGRHAAGLQQALRDADARGVAVHVVALPEGEVTDSLRESLTALRRGLRHVVLQHRMHQKIVVVDERWTFLGSMNLLSHAEKPPARRQEIMVQVESHQFADKVLWHERADDLRNPPSCPACKERMWQAKQQWKPPPPGWYWLCDRIVNGARCQRRVRFADTR